MNESQSQQNSKPFFHFWRCFWLSFLVISLAYAWYCFYVPANDIAWVKNYSEAKLQAAKSEKPVILFFTAQWCVPCRIMKRSVWADKEVAKMVNAEFVPVMVYMDDPEAVAAIKRYGIVSPPSTVVVDSQGTMLDQRQGGMGKGEFLNFLGTLGTRP